MFLVTRNESSKGKRQGPKTYATIPQGTPKRQTSLTVIYHSKDRYHGQRMPEDPLRSSNKNTVGPSYYKARASRGIHGSGFMREHWMQENYKKFYESVAMDLKKDRESRRKDDEWVKQTRLMELYGWKDGDVIKDCVFEDPIFTNRCIEEDTLALLPDHENLTDFPHLATDQ